MIIEAIPCPNECGGYIAYRLAYHPDSNVPKLNERGVWDSEAYCPVCEGSEVLCPSCGTQVPKGQVKG